MINKKRLLKEYLAGKTLNELGIANGVTREWIRQIIRTVLSPQHSYKNICVVCKKEKILTKNTFRYRKKNWKCSACKRYEKSGKGKIIRVYLRKKVCDYCHKRFKKNEYKAKNMHNPSCYRIWQWKNDPKWRKMHSLSVKKWVNKNKEYLNEKRKQKRILKKL